METIDLNLEQIAAAREAAKQPVTDSAVFTKDVQFILEHWRRNLELGSLAIGMKEFSWLLSKLEAAKTENLSIKQTARELAGGYFTMHLNEAKNNSSTNPKLGRQDLQSLNLR